MKWIIIMNHEHNIMRNYHTLHDVWGWQDSGVKVARWKWHYHHVCEERYNNLTPKIVNIIYSDTLNSDTQWHTECYDNDELTQQHNYEFLYSCDTCLQWSTLAAYLWHKQVVVFSNTICRSRIWVRSTWHTHTRTHIRMHACTHVRMHARAHTHMHMHAHTHVSTHTCTHTRAHTHTCVHTK